MTDWPDTSESLILRVQDPADAAAWSAFVAIYRPVIFSMARKRGLQDADADDLAQRVMVSIARTVSRWQPSATGPPFRAWLYRIAHNEILKVLTRPIPDAATGSTSVREMLSAAPCTAQDASAELVRESRLQAFRWAAKEIKDEFTSTTWNMFWQSMVDGRAIAEVAKLCDRSVGSVYLSRYRVMKRLKEKLDEVSDLGSEVS